MIEIKKNVQIPRGRTQKYPLKDMEIGDSFEVDISDRNNLSGSITHFYKTNKDKKFITRKISDEKIGVWRTA